jgi:cation diffusion facilitator family transporter
LEPCLAFDANPLHILYSKEPNARFCMHTHSLDTWRHEHIFLGERHEHNERRTWLVVALTAVMMVAEIVGGTVYGSMALVADGWHMSTHAGALAIAGLSYRFARRHAADPRFSFGTGKVGELAGYSSAIILALVALLIGYESMARLLSPVPISFDQAIADVIGLPKGQSTLASGDGDAGGERQRSSRWNECVRADA